MLRIMAALAFLALPLAAEPMYHLLDCKGQEAICEGAFGPPASPMDPQQYVVNGRTVANGVDLGRGTPTVDVPWFWVLYDRSPWVIGWRFCCDGQDFDGHPVGWYIDGGAATLVELPDLGGPSPVVPGRFTDINAAGQFIGAKPYDEPYIATPRLEGGIPTIDLMGLSVSVLSNAETWQPIVGGLLSTAQLFRINDAGQILGMSGFRTGEDYAGPIEDRLIMLSPIGTPTPAGLHHAPEPGTLALLALGLLACAASRLKLLKRPRR